MNNISRIPMIVPECTLSLCFPSGVGFLLQIATAPHPLRGNRMGTHATTRNRKGAPLFRS